MSDEINRLVEQRQLRRVIIDTLAAPLAGDARARFLADAEEKLNRELPVPGRHHMKLYLRSVE